MDPSSAQGNQEVIRVSRDEALSSRVDDLLKRQMSLRGEPGITRDRRRRWWLQNWFVFGLAGWVAAVGAWAIVEPLFNDLLYVQGAVQQVGSMVAETGPLPPLPVEMRADAALAGFLEIGGEAVWVPIGAKLLVPGGKAQPFDLNSVSVGDQLGVHVELLTVEEATVAIGAYFERDPAPLSARAQRTLKQQQARSVAGGMLLFPIVAGFIGLAIGAADGIVCRLPRRALLAGGVGLLAGFIGGFVSQIVAGLIYAPLTAVAMAQEGTSVMGLSTLGFLMQTGGRGLAWCAAGLAMGLGQGLALRSGRLLLYGLLGGIIGGLLGGLLFDPIDFLILGPDKPSAHWSRLVGIAVIGLSVGVMIGVVEILARDAWLRMTQGPLAGKEFLIFKDLVHVGASPRADIYLFNDPAVLSEHAVIRAAGDRYEIESQRPETPVRVNGGPIRRTRLHDGDQIAIGRTTFVFHTRKS